MGLLFDLSSACYYKEMAKKKSERETCLSGRRMVLKSHRRIVFRGLIDSLEAEVIEAQVLAAERDEDDICQKLGEILGCLRSIMAAEVKEIPLAPFRLFGMDGDEIHSLSHEIKANENSDEGKPALPSFSRGAVASRLNLLRTRVREVELFAVKVFRRREDIILALNRLSSALWWLFCSCHTGT